jgi:hypothetical protein
MGAFMNTIVQILQTQAFKSKRYKTHTPLPFGTWFRTSISAPFLMQSATTAKSPFLAAGSRTDVALACISKR